MSKIIKSNRLNLSDGRYKLSSEVFVSKEKFFSDAEKVDSSVDFNEIENEKCAEESVSEALEDVETEKNSSYTADIIIEQAEAAALEILDNAQEAADGLIADARRSARELSEEAVLSANEAYEKAKANGRQEGFNAGYEDGKKSAEALIDDALEIKNQIRIKNSEFLINKEAEIIDLVLDIAKKVIGKEIQDMDYIEALVSAAMKHLNYATSIILRVSERDYDSAMLVKPKILAMAERIESLEIKIDYALQPGSCVIDTASGSIDASVNTQMERIEDIFSNILSANFVSSEENSKEEGNGRNIEFVEETVEESPSKEIFEEDSIEETMEETTEEEVIDQGYQNLMYEKSQEDLLTSEMQDED